MLFVEAFKKEKKYYAGFDLCDDYCQIAYGELRKTESFPVQVQTLSAGESENDYNIPTLLYKKNGSENWSFGKQAVQNSRGNDGILVSHLFSSALADQAIEIEGAGYDARKLLSLFIRKCLRLLNASVPLEQLGILLFTVPVMNRDTVQLMEYLKEELELPSEILFYEEHDSSFYHYMLNQEETVRSRDVLLCEYKGFDRIHISRLTYNRHTTPVVGYVQNADYGTFPADYDKDMDMRFNRIVQKELAAGNFSATYLIGDGFKGNWMHDSLKLLCRNCRVFQGNNLYSKGAAVSARLRLFPDEITDRYFFLSESKLKFNIGLMAVRSGKEVCEPLLDAGVYWYEASCEKDFILEGTGEVRLVMMPITGGAASEYMIRLDELPVREDRVTRIRVNLSMQTVNHLDIRIRDLGFGEIYPASGLRWEKGITL